MAGIGNANNLRIGDCEVWLGGQLIGHTKGGVEFTFEREFEDLTVDQYGSSPLDMALTGNNLLIKAMVAEPTTQNLSRAIPEGDYDSGSADDKLGLGTDSGYLLRQDAQELRLHPRNKGATDFSEDVYIWKAVSSENIEMAFKVDEQRVVEVTWRALVDENQPDGTRLGRVGANLIS